MTEEIRMALSNSFQVSFNINVHQEGLTVILLQYHFIQFYFPIF